MNRTDTTAFRNALGEFATGVTVITSIDGDEQPVGVTASSFNSVSLDPPLVLWSLAKNAGSLAAFQTSGHFCVHVLAADQEALSQRFATRGSDKFAGLEWQSGIGKAPLLPHFAAQFQCKTTYQYEGGDHVIFVGEVLDYQTGEGAPLVFHKGRYATAKTKSPGEPAGDAVNISEGSFSENFFLYLLSRAHFQASHDLNQELKKQQIGLAEYLSLTLLGMSGALAYQDLYARLEHTGNAPSSANMTTLQEQGLITETVDAARFSLTVKGRDLYVRLLAVSKAAEQRLLDEFDDAEVADVRNFLQRFIVASDPGVPSLWGQQ